MEERVSKSILFFETMIQDKTLIKKRKKKKSKREKDVLYKHPVLLYYRNAYVITMFMIQQYITLWYNNKKER